MHNMVIMRSFFLFVFILVVLVLVLVIFIHVVVATGSLPVFSALVAFLFAICETAGKKTSCWYLRNSCECYLHLRCYSCVLPAIW